MQQSSATSESAKLPYAKWTKHRADNGLIYLSHPSTGQVEWLWCRYHDPKTKRDYLVNLITREKQWVTKKNQHFCPVKASAVAANSSASQPATSANVTSISSTATRQTPVQSSMPKVNIPVSENRSNNPFSNMASYPNRPPPPKATAPAAAQVSPPKFREIAAPKSLGLTPDEALMLVPESGRRYIYNRVTKSSRWLPDRPPDTISAESKGSRFGRGGGSKTSTTSETKQVPSLDEIDAQLAQISMQNAQTFAEIPVQPLEQQTNGHTSTVPNGNFVQNMNQNQNQNQHIPATAPQSTPPNTLPVVDEATVKIQTLDRILQDVKNITSEGKYDMTQLRQICNTGGKEEKEEASKRLLELEEYLTQQTLKVDGVESDGNMDIRARRKDVVKTILTLTDEIEGLRRKVLQS